MKIDQKLNCLNIPSNFYQALSIHVSSPEVYLLNFDHLLDCLYLAQLHSSHDGAPSIAVPSIDAAAGEMGDEAPDQLNQTMVASKVKRSSPEIVWLLHFDPGKVEQEVGHVGVFILQSSCKWCIAHAVAVYLSKPFLQQVSGQGDVPRHAGGHQLPVGILLLL